jgi:Fungal specific transcription factor domain/Fungal Zn(2)-Cys(6) binuclear cluster domain
MPSTQDQVRLSLVEYRSRSRAHINTGRCDRSKPCEHCRQSNLDCTYYPNEKIQLAEFVTSVFSLPKSIQNAPVAYGPSPPTTTLRTTQQSYLNQEQLPKAQSSVQGVHASSSSQLGYDSCADNLNCVLRGDLKGVFSKNRYFGASHWMTSVSTSRLTTKLVLQQEADPNSEICHLTKKCKAASKQINAQDKIISNIASHPNEYVPPREIADSLVQAYLQTFESIYRIIDIPNFQQEYDSYWANPGMSSQAMVTKLLLIMAVGTVFQPLQQATALRSSALQWISVAQTWVSMHFDKYCLTIEGLQIQCLLIFARLVHDVDADLLGLSAGSLLQTAMQLGLHIDAEKHVFPGVSAQDIHLRRKLWATVLEIMVQASIDSGAIPLIRAADYDCKPPLDIDDTKLKHGSAELSSSIEPGDKFAQSSLQIMLSNSLPLRLEIAAFVNDFRLDSSTYENAMSLSERLLKSCTLNSKLFQSFRNSSHYPTDFQIYMVELLTHQYLFALHMPYAAKAKSHHTFYYSRKICLDTARLFLPNHSETMDYAHTHLRLWGGGIFRAIPLQAACFIAEELLYQMDMSTAAFSKGRGFFNKKNELRLCVEEYIESAMNRIRHGHLNVRPYVMMSALLAHIDARIDGHQVEETILATVKKCLTACYEVLCGQLNQLPESFEGNVSATNNEISLQDDFIVSDSLFLSELILIPLRITITGWRPK